MSKKKIDNYTGHGFLPFSGFGGNQGFTNLGQIHNSNRGHGAFHGGRNRWNLKKPQCQLCGRVGHLVQQCFYRFDPSFQGPSSVQNGFPSAQVSSQTTAMVATTLEFVYDCSWYPDTGATTHVTPDVHNLMNNNEFTGQDKIVMGNGTGLDIKHIGQSSFHSQFNSRLLSLNHLLHVTKNLLSVSKFSKDNVVYFEFFPYFCYVKDQASKEILMAERVKN